MHGQHFGWEWIVTIVVSLSTPVAWGQGPGDHILNALGNTQLHGDERQFLLVAGDLAKRLGPQAAPDLEKFVLAELKAPSKGHHILTACTALAYLSDDSAAGDALFRLYDSCPEIAFFAVPFMPPRACAKLAFRHLEECRDKTGLEPGLRRARLACLVARFGDEDSCRTLRDMVPNVDDKQFAIVVESLLARRALVSESVYKPQAYIRLIDQDFWLTNAFTMKSQSPRVDIQLTAAELQVRREIPLEYLIASTYMSRTKGRVPMEARNFFEIEVAAAMAWRSLDDVEAIAADDKRPVELRHQAIEVIALLNHERGIEALLRIHRGGDARTAAWIAEGVLLHQPKTKTFQKVLAALDADDRLTFDLHAKVGSRLREF